MTDKYVRVVTEGPGAVNLVLGPFATVTLSGENLRVGRSPGEFPVILAYLHRETRVWQLTDNAGSEHRGIQSPHLYIAAEGDEDVSRPPDPSG